MNAYIRIQAAKIFSAGDSLEQYDAIYHFPTARRGIKVRTRIGTERSATRCIGVFTGEIFSGLLFPGIGGKKFLSKPTLKPLMPKGGKHGRKHIKVKVSRKHHHSSGSSSSDSTEKLVKKDIKLDEDILSNVLADLALDTEIKKVVDSLEIKLDDLLEDDCIEIESLPATLTAPGTYCIIDDHMVTTAGAAVTVLADNVTLKVRSTIITTGTTSIGVLVDGPSSPNGKINNFILIGGVFRYGNTTTPPDQTVNGVRLLTVNNVNVIGTTTIGYARGINLTLCNGGSVQRCLVQDAMGSVTGFIGTNAYSIRTEGSTGIVIDSCTVTGASFALNGNVTFGVALSAGTGPSGITTPFSDGITVKNCSFNKVNLPYGIFGNNILIKDCNSSLDPISGFATAEIGFADGTPGDQFPANDIQFIDCNFGTITDPAFQPDGLLFILGSNCLIQGCTLNGNTDPAGVDTAIHIGTKNSFGVPDSFFSSVKIVDMIINGSNQEAVLIDSATDVTIDNLVVSDVTVNGIHLIEARNVTIKNSDIQAAPGATGDGVLVEAQASNVTIKGSSIRDFKAGDGIHVRGKVTIIRDNEVYSNNAGIVIDLPADNPVPQNNILFNNPAIIESSTRAQKQTASIAERKKKLFSP